MQCTILLHSTRACVWVCVRVGGVGLLQRVENIHVQYVERSFEARATYVDASELTGMKLLHWRENFKL